MKVAEVRYEGRKGVHTRRSPTGERVRFQPRNRSNPWVGIESVEFARELEDTSNYTVEWTTRGRLLAYGKDVLELGYQKKRSLASDLDLSFDGQPDESELDSAIEDYIETMEQDRGP